MRAQIIGLSHTNALRGALKNTRRAFQAEFDIIHMLKAVPDKQFLHTDGAATYINPTLRERLAKADGGNTAIFSMVGGNAHNFMGLFQHRVPYDIVLPEQTDLPFDPGAELVPYDYVAKVLLGLVVRDLEFLNALRRAMPVPIYHLESPPPVFDNDFCKQNLPPVFLTKQYATMNIAAPFFRYKLWRLHSRIVRQECERIGIGFIPCPGDSIDDSGFLRRAYYIDPLHGNDGYGALILDQITALVQNN